jgi:hypothetical protein
LMVSEKLETAPSQKILNELLTPPTSFSIVLGPY